MNKIIKTEYKRLTNTPTPKKNLIDELITNLLDLAVKYPEKTQEFFTQAPNTLTMGVIGGLAGAEIGKPEDILLFGSMGLVFGYAIDSTTSDNKNT